MTDYHSGFPLSAAVNQEHCVSCIKEHTLSAGRSQKMHSICSGHAVMTDN